jgi:hypothetical protein
MADTYEDATVACGLDHLELRFYYFPFGTKRIPYDQITGLQRIEMVGPLSGKWRLWGTGNLRYWANLDLRRPKKDAGFVIDLGRAVSPIVTPDDPDAFEAVVRARAHLSGADGPPRKRPFI